jgi:molybdopterin molybdotransferase
MRPGKPLLFGRIGALPVLGLPGNPVSSLVCALLFVRPVLRVMQGLAPEPGPPARARLGCDLRANDRRQDYLRASLEPDPEGGALPIATPFAVQDSSVMTGLAAAGCLVIRPPLAPAAAAGEIVDIETFDGDCRY